MIAAVPHLDAIIETTRVQLAIVDSETQYIISMSCESLDESISAAVPDLDGAIKTTRVQLAIINDETPYFTSMPCESSNQTIIVAIRHLNVSTSFRVHLLLIDQRMKVKVRIVSSRTRLDHNGCAQ